MKAPLPYCAARPGKRRKLPRPIALPATARMTPRREYHMSVRAGRGTGCKYREGFEAANQMTTKKLKAQSSKRKRSSNGQNSKSPNAHSSQVERAPGFG